MTQTVAVVSVLISAHDLPDTLTYHLFIGMLHKKLIPVIRNQARDLPGDAFFHEADKHQPSIRRQIRGIEIDLDFLVREYV